MGKKISFRWRRNERATELQAVGYDNRKRSWELYRIIKDLDEDDIVEDLVAYVYNPTADYLSGQRKKDEWIVSALFSYPFRRFSLNRHFSEAEVPEAKDLAKKFFFRLNLDRKEE
jgi:hypothetical protein